MAPLGIRKQPSGAEKRRKRKKVEEFLKSQANAMLKFLKKPENSSFAETVDTPRNDIEDKVDTGQSKVDSVDESKENDEVVHQSEKKVHFSEDMFDPGNWGNIDAKMRDLLVEKGLATRLPTDYQFPKNATGRHFSHALYKIELVKGEKFDRKWLVCSKDLDKAFCFCCKLFKHEKQCGGHLATTGYTDWRNVSSRLKDHERFHDHMVCMIRWKELEVRLQKNQTIDKLINS